MTSFIIIHEKAEMSMVFQKKHDMKNASQGAPWRHLVFVKKQQIQKNHDMTPQTLPYPMRRRRSAYFEISL